jgi:hypothetical protein
MKVEFLVPERGPKENDALLDYDDITPKNKNTITVYHCNQDDSYYGYNFEITGTDEEIKIIKEFCQKIMEAE